MDGKAKKSKKKKDARRVVVRTLKLSDYQAVCDLQIKCFPGMKPWKQDQFESQIEQFPEGQICIEMDGKIVASSSSLIVDFDLYDEWQNWAVIADKNTSYQTLFKVLYTAGRAEFGVFRLFVQKPAG